MSYDKNGCLENIVGVLIALILVYFIWSFVVWVVCKCFGWEFRWIYSLACLILYPIIRSLFRGRQ